MPLEAKLLIAWMWLIIVFMLVSGYPIQVGGNLSPVVVDRKKTPVRYWIQMLGVVIIGIIFTYLAFISEW